MPLRKEMCSTCPFRPGVDPKYSAVLAAVAHSALTDSVSRICHQSGSDNLFHKRTGTPQTICRGARDLQLRLFASMGFLDAPTDEAWAAKQKEMGIK